MRERLRIALTKGRLQEQSVELFERMKREKYFFTRPVSGHWVVPLTRTTVDAVKHPVHFAP